MEVIELKNVIIEDIKKEYLDSIKLMPYDMTDIERNFAWQSKISGSKIKTVLNTPLSLLAYYMGWITTEELDHKLRVIPRMNYFRDYGKIMEPTIVEFFNQAILNEFSVNETDLILRDVLIDTAAVYKVRKVFAPNQRDKLYIKQDKRAFVLNVPGEEDSNIFMINIDGYTTNPDGSVKHLIEIKTKSGAMGEGYDSQSYFEMHIDQIAFYAKMLKPTDGAYLLVDHHSRGLKLHHFTPEDLAKHWEQIEDKIYLFANLYLELLKLRDDDNYNDTSLALQFVDLIVSDHPEDECITKKDLIGEINRIGGDL